MQRGQLAVKGMHLDEETLWDTLSGKPEHSPA